MDPLDTATMTWNQQERRLVAEASDHDATRAACPAELRVRSHKTGAVVTFRRTGQIYAGNPPDRELAATVYRHADTGVELHVLND